ncbi:phosphatase PAP2 family protein [Lysobacter niabensis]|uniref:phosphatase PAP2 family protein n=1 Tax=Agrilutibacter niabensis TaxID=380628 RepID=UPI0036109A73
MSPRVRGWLLCSLLVAFGASGCATLPDGSAWGDSATLTPGWERVRASAVNAAKDPHVWVPLVGAAVFQVGDWDREVADWAQRERPLFGSQRNAARWSDDLRSASSAAYVATVLLTPGGDEPDEWVRAKAKGLGVGLAARGATSLLTQGLKQGVGRERPDGSDELSFPSGHASASAVNTRLASRNLRSIEMSDTTRRVLDVGLVTLTAGTSWARIEAGKHYPSDVLFGMALGNFLAAFINDAFLGARAAQHRGVTLEALPGGLALRVYVIY